MKVRISIIGLGLACILGGYLLGGLNASSVIAQSAKGHIVTSKGKKLLTCPFCGDRFPSLKDHVWAITLADGTRDVWTCDNAIVGKQVGDIVAKDEACAVCPDEPEPKFTDVTPGGIEGTAFENPAGISSDSKVAESRGALIVSGSGPAAWTITGDSLTFATPLKSVCPYCGLDTYPHLMKMPVGETPDGGTVYWETCSVEFAKAIQRLTTGTVKQESAAATMPW